MYVNQLDLAQNLEKLGYNNDSLQHYYPKIVQRIIPLSATGISPRVFLHWKNEGLIDFIIENEKGRNHSWVKLNVMEVLWLKLISVLREFGVSIPQIRGIKQTLLRDTFELFTENMDSIEKVYASKPDQLALIKDLANFYSKHRSLLPPEGSIMSSLFASYVTDALVRRRNVSLYFYQNESNLLVSALDKEDERIELFPYIKVSLKFLWKSYFFDELMDPFNATNGLYTQAELKILEMVRSKKFSKINIIIDKKQNLSIKASEIVDKNGQNVKLIKQILGFKDYNKATLTLRNDKHLVIENEYRLKFNK